MAEVHEPGSGASRRMGNAGPIAELVERLPDDFRAQSTFAPRDEKVVVIGSPSRALLNVVLQRGVTGWVQRNHTALAELRLSNQKPFGSMSAQVKSDRFRDPKPCY